VSLELRRLAVLIVSRWANEKTDVKFYKFDVDKLPDVAQELSISAMPTFKIFKDGEIVGDVVGARPPAILAAIASASA
jgi:thioredoxin 1